MTIAATAKPKDDWNVPSGTNQTWGDHRQPTAIGGNRNLSDGNTITQAVRNDPGSWTSPAPGIRPTGSGPPGSGPPGGQWNSNVPPPSRTSGWDNDSPPMSRRNDGTSFWGREQPPGPPGAPPIGNYL